MEVKEFRSKIKANQKLIVGEKEFVVKEVVKFRFDDGSFYIKCFLNDGYVFADDLNENIFLLVQGVDTFIKKPFPKELKYDGKSFKFIYNAHAIAEKVEGEEIFKKDDSESFWDYESEDDGYLSLGINDQSGEREDYYGKIIKGDQVNLK